MASLSGVHHACMAASITRSVSVRRAHALLCAWDRVFVSGAVCVCVCCAPRNIGHAWGALYDVKECASTKTCACQKQIVLKRTLARTT
jgi:hypothetical protein